MFPSDSKIMIVDDSSFARGMLKNALKEMSYWKILEADNAKSAQALMEEDEQKIDPVHLLITDLNMPEMTGLDLLKWVRGHAELGAMPVIMLTSSVEKEEILAAGKLGVSHYLVKPFDASTLKDKLTSTWIKHGEKYFTSAKKN